MSNPVISQIQLPNNTVYDIKPTNDANLNTNGVYYITCNENSTNSALKATLDGSITSYYPGLKVVLYHNRATDTSVGVSLNINGLGPVGIRKTGWDALEEGLIKNGIYNLCYNGQYFVMDGYVNSGGSTIGQENPVAGTVEDAPCRLYAGANIAAYDLVYYDITANTIKPINSNTTFSDICYEWGLAVCTASVSTGDTIHPNALLQNACILKEVQEDITHKYDDRGPKSSPIYLMFGANRTKLIATAAPVQIENKGYLPFNGLAGYQTNDGTYIGHYIYIGMLVKAGTSAMLQLDLSNHDFITLAEDTVSNTLIDNYYASIDSINGRFVGGSDSSSHTVSSYNNPVSGNGMNLVAAYDISKYDLVAFDTYLNGLVPLDYYLSDSIVSGLLYDWGLAICTEDVSVGNRPSNGALLQQVTLETSNSSGKTSPLYAYFSAYGEPLVATSGFPEIIGKQTQVHSMICTNVPDWKGIRANTYIYLGIWQGNYIHIDLSNHNFISTRSLATGAFPGVAGTLLPITSGSDVIQNQITHINGRNTIFGYI